MTIQIPKKTIFVVNGHDDTPEEMERAYGMHEARIRPWFKRREIILPESVREPNNFFKRAVSGALALLMAGYIGLAPAKASAHMIGPTHVYQLGPSVVQPWSVKSTEDNPYKSEGDTNGDGVIDGSDLIKMARHLGDDFRFDDLDGDGTTNIVEKEFGMDIIHSPQEEIQLDKQLSYIVDKISKNVKPNDQYSLLVVAKILKKKL